MRTGQGQGQGWGKRGKEEGGGGKTMGADQWDDDEGRGGGESHDVGPDTRHVQDAHAP